MTLGKLAIVGSIVLGLVPDCALASSPGNQPLFQQNTSYEQALRYQASVDKIITPAKVIRWILSLRGDQLSAPSPIEFQPIVRTRDSRLQVIAALAYKF